MQRLGHLGDDSRYRFTCGDLDRLVVFIAHFVHGHKRLVAALIGEGRDHALVEQAGEGLGRRDFAKIVEDLVPEARIQQVQYRMFSAADIEIDPGLAHPVRLTFA